MLCYVMLCYLCYSICYVMLCYIMLYVILYVIAYVMFAYVMTYDSYTNDFYERSFC